MMATLPQYETAYDDPATPRAWRAHLLMRVGQLALCCALWVFVVFLAVMTPVWLVWLHVILLGFLALLAVHALGGLLKTRRMRRVLRTYPWQRFPGAARIAKNGSVLFVVPDPEHPDKTVSLTYGSWLGSGLTFWVRQVKSQALDEIWFAGDPRFLAVVAVPGPRRLINVAQPEALNSRMSPRKKGVGPQARERARAVGARVG